MLENEAFELELLSAIEGPPEELPASSKEFTIDSEDKLEWVLNLIRKNKIYGDAQKAYYQKKLAKIDEMREKIEGEMNQAMAPYQNNIRQLMHRFGLQIQEYVFSTLGKREQSRKIFGFQIGKRMNPGSVHIPDQEKLINYMDQALDGSLRGYIKRSVPAATLKQLTKDEPLCNEDGEVLAYIRQEEVSYIKFGDETLS